MVPLLFQAIIWSLTDDQPSFSVGMNHVKADNTTDCHSIDREGGYG